MKTARRSTKPPAAAAIPPKPRTLAAADGTSNRIAYGERFKFPGLAMGLAVAAGPLELAIPPVLVGLVIARAALPTWKRTVVKIKASGRLDVELLDSLWLLFHTLTGEMFAPALALCLTEAGNSLRDATANAGARQKPHPIPNRHYWIERKGRRRKVLSKDLRQGDQVLLGAGDSVPADGIAIRGEALVDQHELLGGAKLLPRVTGDEVLASTLVVRGQLLIELQQVGNATRVSQIAGSVKEIPWGKTRIHNYLEEVADHAVAPALGASVLLMAATGNVHSALAPLQLDFAQGIGISAPIAVLASLQHAGNNRVLIRSGHALEKLAQLDAVVFDKTGTLTECGVQVTAVETLHPSVSEEELLSLAAAASYYVLRPFSASLIDYVEAKGITVTPCDPLEYTDIGVVAEVDGQRISVGTMTFMEEQGITVDSDYHRRHDGVILSRSVRYLARNGEILGAVFYTNPLRPESAATIETLHSLGIACYLVTGDTSKAANAIAYKLGIGLGCTYSEASAEHKVEILKRLRKKHKAVAYVGDGVNDAPAMSRADVAVSFRQATDLARETADVVLLDDGLLGLPYAIGTARQAMTLVRQNIVTVTSGNVAAVLGGVLFNLSPTAAVVINNGATLLAGLNGLRPLLAGERQDAEIQKTVIRDDEGLLGIPWRKRSRNGVAGLLDGRAQAQPG